jgi:hypothetical protein
MCKEMSVIPVNRVVAKKRIIRKRQANKEERHKGSLTQKIKYHPGNLLSTFSFV